MVCGSYEGSRWKYGIINYWITVKTTLELVWMPLQ